MWTQKKTFMMKIWKKYLYLNTQKEQKITNIYKKEQFDKINKI